jgi:hypothetical protein
MIAVFMVRVQGFFETKLELKVSLIPIIPVLFFVLIAISVLILDKESRKEIIDITKKLK